MNWEAVGAIGEVVGAIGVIATLGYLATQIRQNSGVVRSATRQAISTTQLEVGMRIAENPDLRAAYARIMSGEAPETADRIITDEMVLRASFRMFENQYHQHEDGTFDEQMWAGYLEHMSRLFALPAVLAFWAEHRMLYSTDFVAFVDALIARQGASGEEG